jgi:hypothetical protein
VIADLATPPNFAAGVTRTVLADNIAPTLTGVTYKTTDVAPASLVIDGTGNIGGAAVAATSVQYVSKAPGAAGNGYSVDYVAGTWSDRIHYGEHDRFRRDHSCMVARHRVR